MDAGRDENEVSGDSGLSIPDGSLGQRILIYSDAKSNIRISSVCHPHFSLCEIIKLWYYVKGKRSDTDGSNHFLQTPSHLMMVVNGGCTGMTFQVWSKWGKVRALWSGKEGNHAKYYHTVSR